MFVQPDGSVRRLPVRRPRPGRTDGNTLDQALELLGHADNAHDWLQQVTGDLEPSVVQPGQHPQALPAPAGGSTDLDPSGALLLTAVLVVWGYNRIVERTTDLLDRTREARKARRRDNDSGTAADGDDWGIDDVD